MKINNCWLRVFVYKNLDQLLIVMVVVTRRLPPSANNGSESLIFLLVDGDLQMKIVIV